jgi:hypothetical protein
LLPKYQYPVPPKSQHAPAKSTPVKHGANVLQKTRKDVSAELSPGGIKKIQYTVGTVAWYFRATDSTMAQTLNSIASRQAKATTQLKEEVTPSFDYCATHPDAIVRYKASDMILTVHSDASHLLIGIPFEKESRRFYLVRKDTWDIENGAILTLSKIIKHVMGSTGKSEVVALCSNCKRAIQLESSLQVSLTERAAFV